MRVVQINNVYPFRSTGKIVKDLHSYYLGHNLESYVIFGFGEGNNRNEIRVSNRFFAKVNALVTRLTGLMYGACLIETHRIKRQLKRINPDIVHVHCLNSHAANVYNLLSWLKKKNFNVIVTHHAEFYYTANCGYAFDCLKYNSGCYNCDCGKAITHSWLFNNTHKSWALMQKALCGFDKIINVSVSPWLYERVKSSKLFEGFQHYCVLNGVNTELFNYSEDYNDENYVLHVSNYFTDDNGHIKGGLYLIELAKKMPKNTFLVVGPYKPNMNLPDNVKVVGEIKDQRLLAEYYKKASVTVITSYKESFSMVVPESLCCGTPVVGFKCGAPEMISIKEFSHFVNFGDINEMRNRIEQLISNPHSKKMISNIAISKYSKDKMCSEYLEIYKKMLNKSK